MCNVFTVDLDLAVAERFKAIRPRLKEREGDYCYFGLRPSANQLGARYRYLILKMQEVPGSLPGEVLAGKFDREIEEVWHERAKAEHWYREEENWH